MLISLLNQKLPGPFTTPRKRTPQAVGLVWGPFAGRFKGGVGLFFSRKEQEWMETQFGVSLCLTPSLWLRSPGGGQGWGRLVC